MWEVTAVQVCFGGGVTAVSNVQLTNFSLTAETPTGPQPSLCPWKQDCGSMRSQCSAIKFPCDGFATSNLYIRHVRKLLPNGMHGNVF